MCVCVCVWRKIVIGGHYKEKKKAVAINVLETKSHLLVLAYLLRPQSLQRVSSRLLSSHSYLYSANFSRGIILDSPVMPPEKNAKWYLLGWGSTAAKQALGGLIFADIQTEAYSFPRTGIGLP